MVKRIVWAILLVMSILLVWVGLAQQPATPVHQTTKHLAQGQASQMPLYTEKRLRINLARYPQLRAGIQRMIPMPGLQGAWALAKNKSATASHRLIKTVAFDPQGITTSQNEIFVSAYDHNNKANSVIYVLNKWTGQYIKTLSLQFQDHAGGVAYDPDRQMLWVTGHDGKDSMLYGITQAQIDQYDIRSRLPISYQQVFQITTETNNSTMMYANNALWVGYFTKRGLGNIQELPFGKDASGNLTLGQSAGDQDESIVAATKVYASVGQLQGLTANQRHVLMTSSFGNVDGKLVRYDREAGDKFAKGVSVTMPPYLEAVSYDGDTNRFYMIFESATPVYRVKTKAVVDRILYVDNDVFKTGVTPFTPLLQPEFMDLTRPKTIK